MRKRLAHKADASANQTDISRAFDDVSRTIDDVLYRLTWKFAGMISVFTVVIIYALFYIR